MLARSTRQFRHFSAGSALAARALPVALAATLVLAGCAGGDSRVEGQPDAGSVPGPAEDAAGAPESHPDARTAESAHAPEHPDAPIKLGMLVPLTGTESEFGESMRNGAQLAVDELNRGGGVLGRELELVVVDDACDAVTAFEAAPRLVAAGIAASVGGYCAGAVLPTLPIFGEAGIPSVVPAGAPLALIGQGAFLTGAGPVHEAAAWLNVARQYRPAGETGEARSSGRAAPITVALLDDHTASARELATLFLQRLELLEQREEDEQAGYAAWVDDAARGNASARFEQPEESDRPDGSSSGLPAVVHAGSVRFGEGNLPETIQTILESHPDLLIWTGHPAVGVPFVGGLRAAGFRGPILVSGSAEQTDPLASIEAPGVISPPSSAGPVGAFSLDSYAAAGLAELVYATVPPTPDLLSPEDERIVAYTNAFGIAPGQYSLEAHEAVRVVAGAITVAGSTEGDRVVAALQAFTPAALLSGKVSLGETGLLAGSGSVRIVASVAGGAGVRQVTDLRRWPDSRPTA